MDDTSVDIYVQNQEPDDQDIKEHNWLPAPQGTFHVMLRMYWPTTDVLYGTSAWQMPAVEENKDQLP